MNQADVNKVREILPKKNIFQEIAKRTGLKPDTIRKIFNNYDDNNMIHIKVIQTAMTLADEIDKLKREVKSIVLPCETIHN